MGFYPQRSVFAVVFSVIFAAAIVCAQTPVLSGASDKTTAKRYWRGGYFGPAFSLHKLQNTYNPQRAIINPKLKARGKAIGAIAGYNFLHNDYMLGLEADIATGSPFNDDLALISTARARIGLPLNYTLPFITGGLGLARLRKSTAMTSSNSNRTQLGLVVGGGVEHVLAHAITGRLEYTYGRFFSTDSFSTSANSPGVKLKHLHMFRASIAIHLRD